MRLVLLPGLDGTGDLFSEFVSGAPTGIETQVVSYPTAETFSYSEYVDYVDRLLPKNADYLLLAESFSGPVAISLAARSPSGAVGLILCNTFAVRPYWEGLRHLPWKSVFGLPIGRIIVGAVLTGFGGSSQWTGPIRNANRKVSSVVQASRMKSILSVDVRDRLQDVNLPILCLRGKADRLVGSRSARQIVAANPKVRLHVIDGPHLLLQVAPKLAWGAILDFINQSKETG